MNTTHQEGSARARRTQTDERPRSSPLGKIGVTRDGCFQWKRTYIISATQIRRDNTILLVHRKNDQKEPLGENSTSTDLNTRVTFYNLLSSIRENHVVGPAQLELI